MVFVEELCDVVSHLIGHLRRTSLSVLLALSGIHPVVICTNSLGESVGQRM